MIKKYTKKDGSTAYMFKAYLGTDSEGKQRFTTRRGFRTKKQANLELSRLKVDISKNGFKKSDKMTFQQVYDLWVVNYELTVKESTFVKQTEQYRVHILPFFGDTLISKITPAMVQKFANEKVNKFVRYREFISNTSRIFDYAIKLKLINTNPCKSITIPKAKKDAVNKNRENYFSREEMLAFLTALEKHDNLKIATFFRLLSMSSARMGEILGLEWRSVNFEDNYISITQTLARGKNRRLYLEEPKTSSSTRDIPLDQITMDWLKKWRKKQREELLIIGHNSLKPDQLVFSSAMDNSFIQLSKPRKWLQTILKQENLKTITIHGLRHSGAVMMLESGLTLKDIQDRLGHSDISITSAYYLHISEKRKRETIDQMTDYINSGSISGSK
ncbi:integrase [Enterococcus durans]|uniref:tyrosine-type recombinase/integrase n=1 Tax=Enterococcus durans TaxID=53345 RepID=UPI000E03207A|nr:tyrosine-type recombinase/integrase [Enterococcus durans]STP39309.1 integrase [Enterococcus durans]